jgi:hypothetical protein
VCGVCVCVCVCVRVYTGSKRGSLHGGLAIAKVQAVGPEERVEDVVRCELLRVKFLADLALGVGKVPGGNGMLPVDHGLRQHDVAAHVPLSCSYTLCHPVVHIHTSVTLYTHTYYVALHAHIHIHACRSGEHTCMYVYVALSYPYILAIIHIHIMLPNHTRTYYSLFPLIPVQPKKDNNHSYCFRTNKGSNRPTNFCVFLIPLLSLNKGNNHCYCVQTKKDNNHFSLFMRH